MMTKSPVFTIGHSNHPIEVFCRLLVEHRIETIADVRSFPRSQWSPQFNRQRLCQSLKAIGVEYVYFGAQLGGLPSRSRAAPPIDYAARSAMPEFSAAMTALDALAAGCRVAVMCAEKDPIACHRNLLIGKRLTELNFPLLHIRSDGSLESHDVLAQRQGKLGKTVTEDLFSPPDN
jgi:uncharacterized protein (DUF488 family)